MEPAFFHSGLLAWYLAFVVLSCFFKINNVVFISKYAGYGLHILSALKIYL